MVRLFALVAFVALAGVSTLSASAQSAAVENASFHPPTLTVQHSGTTNQLIGISPVNDRVVWASGAMGTYLKTTDGGQHWKIGVVPGAETLQFRDVQGVSERVAYLLSIGTGTDSRIYKTEDGGDHWSLEFQNQNPNAFYDCFAFWSGKHGLATSDSVNGRFPAIKTTNGQDWIDIGDHLPKAATGEASFAASGTCVATQGQQRAWIATGGSKYSHILATTDGGNTWARYYVPTVQGTPSSGIFSVAFRDARHGIEGAGDLDMTAATHFQKNIARSCDGGKTWQLSHGTPFVGAVYGLAYARWVTTPYADDATAQAAASEETAVTSCANDRNDSQQWRTVVATGPGGAAWTADEGATWHLLPGVLNYWAVAFASPQAGWLVGKQGTILKISF